MKDKITFKKCFTKLSFLFENGGKVTPVSLLSCEA